MSHPNSRQLSEIMDAISADEKAVRQASFDAILAKAPASVEVLSQRTGLPPSAVAEAVAHLADLGIVVRDSAGAVVGSRGLTLVPTSHRLRMSGYDYYGWCAEDVIGIPAALKADATVTSSCFQCGREVLIEIKQGEVVRASPQDVRLWIAEAQVGRSIVGNF